MIVHYRHTENPDTMLSGADTYECIENKVILKREEYNVTFRASLINVYGLAHLAMIARSLFPLE